MDVHNPSGGGPDRPETRVRECSVRQKAFLPVSRANLGRKKEGPNKVGALFTEV